MTESNPLCNAIQRALSMKCGKEFQRLFKRPITDIFYEYGWDFSKFDEIIEWREGISTLDRLDELGPEYRTLFDKMRDIELKLTNAMCGIIEERKKETK